MNLNFTLIRQQLAELHARECDGLQALEAALSRAQAAGLCLEIAAPPFPLRPEPPLAPKVTKVRAGKRRKTKTRAVPPPPAKPARRGRPRKGESVESAEIDPRLVRAVNSMTGAEFDIHALTQAVGATTESVRDMLKAACAANLMTLVRAGKPYAPALYAKGPRWPLDPVPAPAAGVTKIATGRLPGRVSFLTAALRQVLADKDGWYSVGEVLGWITAYDAHLVDTENKRTDLRVRLIDMCNNNELLRQGVGPEARYSRGPRLGLQPGRKLEDAIHVPRELDGRED